MSTEGPKAAMCGRTRTRARTTAASRAGRQRVDRGGDVGAVVGLVVLVAGLVVVVDGAGMYDLDEAAADVISVGDRLGRRGGRGAKQADGKASERDPVCASH